MRNSWFNGRLVSTSIMLVSGVCVAATRLAAVANGGPSYPAVSATRLPAGSGRLGQQLDGGLVLWAHPRLFLSSINDPQRWRDSMLEEWPALPPGIWWPAGGERKCLYFCYSGNDGRFSLCRVEPGREPRKLRDLSIMIAAFASAHVGVVAEERKLLLTVDAGETWKEAATLGVGAGNVRSLLWVSATRVVAGGEDGGIECLEMRDGGLSSVWRARPALAGVLELVQDGDHLWAWQELDLFRLDLATGKLDARLAAGSHLDGMAVCHGRLIQWGGGARDGTNIDITKSREIRVWEKRGNDNKYERTHELPGPPVVGIVELEAPRCLVLTEMGNGIVLNLSTGVHASQELQVVHAPVVEQRDPNYASKDEVRAALALLLRLPMDEQDAIATEVNQREDLTPKQRTELLAERARAALERQEAAVGNGAGEETGDEGKGE